MKPTNVADIYPLSSTQQGLLFHARCTPESGLYFVQWTAALHGDLDPPTLQRAWQAVLARHPALRTLFLWEGLDEPVQVVRQQVRLPWAEHDWRDRSALEQQAELERFLHADQAHGFDLARAPLLRLALLRMADDLYQLVWSFHHLLLDGWSVAVVLDEVAALYHRLRQNQDVALAPVRPYRDYIAWLQQQDLRAAERFWRDALAGISAPTPLTVDVPRQEVLTPEQYADEELRLPQPDSAALRAFARAHGLTLSTLVQGAWALLLSRYSGEPDVVFGSVVAGRPTTWPDADTLIGLFVNTLPTRVRVPPSTPVLPWLRSFQEHQAEARQYDYSPLVQVQGWSQVPRGLPLFESLVTFENYPLGDSARAAGIDGIAVHDARILERTNYPLTVSVITGESLCFKLTYSRSRFAPEAVHRMAGHLQTLLRGMVADPQRCLGDVPLLSPSEHQQVVIAWNATARRYDVTHCLHTLIEEQVARTPDAIALIFEGQQLSYRELNARSNQLARYLRRLGVGPETLIGVCLERSFELVIALLGILKAGAAYLPLDPDYPVERLAFMIADAQVPVLLTQRAAADGRLSAPHVACLDADRPEIAAESTENLEGGANPHNLAYVIYTSGSTGKPKGAMNTHAAICNRLLWMQDAYQLTPDDRVLQKTPYSFDVSVWEFFWPLLTGAALVVARPGGHRDCAYLAQLIAAQGVTTLHFVPSMLHVFLEEPDLSGCASLRRVICSGEALPFDLQQRCFARLGAELHNLYGPTEAAVDVTFWACQRDSQLKTVPIGRPIANTQIYLLNSRLQAVPVGVPGELYIGGVGVARGYLNRPALTAERFIPDPFRAEPGARLYKTGDLARFLPDGAIEYLGRIDHQVKLRGFRIELGEVEVVLRQHPAVRDAAVIVHEERPGDQRLVAYYIVAPDTAAPDNHPAQLRAFLQEHLPDYMVPSALVPVPTLPLSPNGKLDRAALPAPEPPRLQPTNGQGAPQTATERRIAEIWRAALRVDAVGVHDNFFDIGGHSLLLAHVHGKLREAFSQQIAIVDLFAHPTIHALAGFLNQQGAPPTVAEPDAAAQLKTGRDRLRQLRQRQRV